MHELPLLEGSSSLEASLDIPGRSSYHLPRSQGRREFVPIGGF